MPNAKQDATLIVAAAANGAVVCCADGLSFWGGVDPDTGVVIDTHHPLHGAELAGKIVLMPTSRGSCSGSGVLLELARKSKAPAALIFSEDEQTLTLGAIVADVLFEAPVAVVRVSPIHFNAIARATSARLDGATLAFEDQTIALSTINTDAIQLSAVDQQRLNGLDGPAPQIAMQVLQTMAAIQGAKDFVDVTQGHIDGCILAHDANLLFAEKMQRLGAKVQIPTTINAISVDRVNWRSQGVDPAFGEKASRLADAYVAMGASPSFTCAPYLLENAPTIDENIGWSESNAVIYANSVLAARTQKHPDYLDLFVAITGRAPRSGAYLSDKRKPTLVVHVSAPANHDESLWPMLGWLTGLLSPSRVPILTGLESVPCESDDLKALCAAFGTTSAAPMLHVLGHTPEADRYSLRNLQTCNITAADVLQVWRDFNRAEAQVDLVAIGSPHASIDECRRLKQLTEGKRCQASTRMIVTVGRAVLAAATQEGITDALIQRGVQVLPDLCWCSITEPLFPETAKVLMTNSGKYAHYAKGLTGRAVRFGSLADCVNTAISGRAPADPPRWLKMAAANQELPYSSEGVTL